MDQCSAVFISYNDIPEFPPGNYNNGRVFVIKAKIEDFETKWKDCAAMNLVGFSMVGVKADRVVVYFGRGLREEDKDGPWHNMLGSIINLTKLIAKDLNQITILGCSCSERQMRRITDYYGFRFESCSCGGGFEMKKMIQEAIAVTEKLEKPLGKLVLKPCVFLSDLPYPDSVLKKDLFFRNLGINGNLWLLGDGQGRIFVREEGKWIISSLNLHDGNRFTKGPSVIVSNPEQFGGGFIIGDGACCSGAVWYIFGSNSFKKMIPKFGQGSNEPEGDLLGNVHGIVRFRMKYKTSDELLVGVGGCNGAHIYKLESDQLTFHPSDLNEYVLTMSLTAEGKVLILTSGGIYVYNGSFAKIGTPREGSLGSCEFEGKVFLATTESGMLIPSPFSFGIIDEIVGGKMKKVWKGDGGVSSFFVHNGKLFAFGSSLVDWSTNLLKRDDAGEWSLLACFSENLKFFSSNGILYALSHNPDVNTDENIAIISEVIGI